MVELQQRIRTERRKSRHAQQKRAQDAAAGIEALTLGIAELKSLRNWEEPSADEPRKSRRGGKLLGKAQKDIDDPDCTGDRKAHSPRAQSRGPQGQPGRHGLPVPAAAAASRPARAGGAQGLANAEANVASNQEQATAKLEALAGQRKH